jgi:phage-related tail fiber protein
MMSNYVITMYMSSDPGTYMVHIRFAFQKPGVTGSRWLGRWVSTSRGAVMMVGLISPTVAWKGPTAVRWRGSHGGEVVSEASGCDLGVGCGVPCSGRCGEVSELA